jgi:hypothetical protein
MRVFYQNGSGLALGGNPSGGKSQQYSGENHRMILKNKSFTRACPPGSFLEKMARCMLGFTYENLMRSGAPTAHGVSHLALSRILLGCTESVATE